MEITSVVENTSGKALPVEHGLSLYIKKNDGLSILFDMGQSSLFASNAEQLSLSVADVDIAVISHGHYDHGGGLATFLKENRKAKVYVHNESFLPHYSLRENGLCYIGLDKQLENNNRLVFCRDLTRIGKDMIIFANVRGNICKPAGNRLLFGPDEITNDTFSHEQNLIIGEKDNIVLFAGCAHCGIANIIHKMQETTGKVPTHVLAGMHLAKSGLEKSAEDAYIHSLAAELGKYTETMFYTMHCTGQEQFRKLKSIMGSQIEYLSCGDALKI